MTSKNTTSIPPQPLDVEIRKSRRKSSGTTARPNKTKQTVTTTVISKGSLYNPEYCELLKKHCSKGLSYESFAATIKVGRRTLYAWENQYPAWSEAKEEAYEMCLLYWERIGIAGVLGVFPEKLFADMPKAKPKFNAAGFAIMVNNRLRRDFQRIPEQFTERTPSGSASISQQTKDPVKATDLYNKLMGNK